MVSQWSEELRTKSVVISGHGDAKFSVGLGAGAGRDGLVVRHRVLNYRRYCAGTGTGTGAPGIPPGYIVPIAKRSPPLQHRASFHVLRRDPGPALRNLATRSSIFRLAEKARVSS